MRSLVLFLSISALIFTSSKIEKEDIIRLKKPSILKEIHSVIPLYIDFKDTLSNDTLLEYLGENKVPIMFARKFQTGVCIDGKCRILNIELYWNITGRYLGFKLPDREFLSKTDHVKFNSAEYDKLHQLLANPNSELANYSLKKLVPVKDTTKIKVDAVSSATLTAVLDFVVPGAVYTTYTLWQIVYGSTKHEIEKITAEWLTAEIVLELLNSQNTEDKIWTLKHIPQEMEISGKLRDKLMKFISGNDVYLSELSLNALQPEALTSEVQMKLIEIFNKTELFQKRLIIRKLEDSPKLESSVAIIISSELNGFSGILVKTALDMLSNQKVEDETVTTNIARLLNHENRYIAKQAFRYLDNCRNLNSEILIKIEIYKKIISINYE